MFRFKAESLPGAEWAHVLLVDEVNCHRPRLLAGFTGPHAPLDAAGCADALEHTLNTWVESHVDARRF